MKILKKAFIIAITFAFSSTLTFADSAWLGGSGNTPVPLDSTESPDIQMVNEQINLEIEHLGPDPEGNYQSTRTNVDVTYLFENHSDQEVTVKMGFPEVCENSEFECEPDYEEYNSALIDFKAWIDGQSLDVTYEEGTWDGENIEQINWHTYEVTFQPNQVRTLRNTYSVNSNTYKSGPWTEYILETGATWKGLIEQVDITVEFKSYGGNFFTPYHLIDVQPGGFFVNESENTITWQLKNIEPTEEDNISIQFEPPGFIPYECYWSEESRDQASSSLAGEIDVHNYENSLLYYPCQARDGDVNTAWVEGVEGPGINEWVQIPLAQDKDYTKVWIFNGYGSSQELWEKNNRVKKAKLTFDGYPNFEQIIEFADSDIYGMTEFVLDQTISNSTYAKIEILEVYPGTEFDDTAISEIQFLGLLDNRSNDQAPSNQDYDGPFPDIAGHQYESAIKFAYDMGYVNGHPDGTYKPNDSINRAEFTKIITEATTDDEITGENCFPDVKIEWFSKYVCHAKNLQIIEGYPDGMFRPADNVNYVEAMKIILGAYDEYVPPARDDQEWFEPYLIHGQQIGVNLDVENDHLLTRGEMAELIRQMFIYLSKAG